MTISPSQRPNLDPKPWVNYADDGAPQRHDDELSAELRDNGIMLDYLPRPEFDVGDNPILRAVCDYEFPVEEIASLDLARGGDDRWFWFEQGATPEQIDHARTVLEAIVREK